MTDYQTIADRIMAQEVGKDSGALFGNFRYQIDDSYLLTNKEFCHDWRVAGELMEKCSSIEIDTIGNPWWVATYALKRNEEGNQLPEKWHKVKGESLPLAIVLATLEALEQ